MPVGVAEAPNAAGRDDAPLAGSAVFRAGTLGASDRSPGVDAPEEGRGRAGDAEATAACLATRFHQTRDRADLRTSGRWYGRCEFCQCAVPRSTVPFPMMPPDFSLGRHLSS